MLSMFQTIFNGWNSILPIRSMRREPKPKEAYTSLPLKSGLHLPISYNRHPRARRYKIRVIRHNSLKLVIQATLPWRGSKQEAYQFILQKRDWIELQLKSLQTTQSNWKLGGSIFIEGEREIIELKTVHERTGLFLGSRIIDTPSSFDPELHLQNAIENHLIQQAQEKLKHRTLYLAQRHQLNPTKIIIRNQRSRWGSCSSNGTISLNWRLIQMPEWVSDYVILHELMHLREMNHSQKFWELVENAYPAWREAKIWIRKHARELGM